jgi:hypothetical protein
MKERLLGGTLDVSRPCSMTGFDRDVECGPTLASSRDNFEDGVTALL